jgi:16S rRNA (guanine527-N7)-methyltransferase
MMKEQIAELLEPFALSLDDTQLELIRRYLDLLMRWNRAVNLTAIRNPEEAVTRHFGESLYLTRFAELRGPLLDVGSGAGFPGLALKIVAAELRVVLLEPVAKKRAFLKEVTRECGFREVEVSGERVEDFGARHTGEFESVTLRAVGGFGSVLPAVGTCLAATGWLFAWLTGAEGVRLAAMTEQFDLFAWRKRVKVPMSVDREIWAGQARST